MEMPSSPPSWINDVKAKSAWRALVIQCAGPDAPADLSHGLAMYADLLQLSARDLPDFESRAAWLDRHCRHVGPQRPGGPGHADMARLHSMLRGVILANQDVDQMRTMLDTLTGDLRRLANDGDADLEREVGQVLNAGADFLRARDKSRRVIIVA